MKNLLIVAMTILCSLYAYSQNDNPKFSKIYHKKSQKIVKFKILNSTITNEQGLIESLLEEYGILKIEFGEHGLCTAVLKPEVSAKDMQKTLKCHDIIFDPSVEKTETEGEPFPVLKGNSREEKMKYEKEVDAWYKKYNK